MLVVDILEALEIRPDGAQALPIAPCALHCVCQLVVQMRPIKCARECVGDRQLPNFLIGCAQRQFQLNDAPAGIHMRKELRRIDWLANEIVCSRSQCVDHVLRGAVPRQQEDVHVPRKFGPAAPAGIHFKPLEPLQAER